MRAVRVLVVDDSALVRQTVTRILSLDPRITVVGSAADGRQALAAVESLSPDVVTLDLDMPVMDGLTCLGELVRRFRQRVVVLSTLALENAFPTLQQYLWEMTAAARPMSRTRSKTARRSDSGRHSSGCQQLSPRRNFLQRSVN